MTCVIGEFGPNEGTITPRYARYWFENVGDEDLEILQVGAYGDASRTAAAAPIPRRSATRSTPRTASTA